MAYTFIQSATGRSQSGSPATAITDSADFTGADTLFLIVVQGNGIASDPTITDNVGTNTWDQIARSRNTGRADCMLYRCAGADVSNSMVVGADIPNEYAAFGLVLFGFSGGHASPDDQYVLHQEQDAVTSITAGSTDLTPVSNDCIIIAGMAYGVGPTIDDGFTILNIDTVTSESWGASGAYLIQTNQATVNPTFSFSTADAAALLASFKPATVSTANRLILRHPA